MKTNAEKKVQVGIILMKPETNTAIQTTGTKIIKCGVCGHSKDVGPTFR
ncbi:uncharacterized protein PGTG_22392 [Puccinia graminis f. sp. tritici CRL 75-36-700-3]|uniref:Uncharacterized protein n=1 Tax=Puccinia graminis f. sp. tritici (strain CRL 75-36-700-3 / race SCCL) TaxID=418459 RepID=H6QUE1_PUCGT|nr:uncharacterized protein PGTG_22392 [Puccinia graminis f. sp. tritici CRL 75-36-700-3]EHS64604.1 hypothetical protein PGTG_22392 [Puccinia graminis f. sp. tritici CRL 75-36-700-3]